jgi:hypothetical protein
VEACLALLSPADVEVGHVDLMPRREFLEDVVVPRWDRVVDVILGGDEQYFHFYLLKLGYAPRSPRTASQMYASSSSVTEGWTGRLTTDAARSSDTGHEISPNAL